MNRYTYIALLLSIVPFIATAQTHPKDSTLNRVMVVEHEYTPEIIDAIKINVLPQIEPPVVTKKAVEYAVSSSPATEIPAETMQPFIGEESQPRPKTGLIRAGAGNGGNIDVLGNYLFQISPKDELDVFFEMEGRKGNLDYTGYDFEKLKWKSHYYRTRAAINYLHRFDKVEMNVAGRFGLSNFNYSPLNWDGKQKLTSGDFHFAVKSAEKEQSIQFEAETNYLIYQRKLNLFNYGAMTENRIKTRGNVWGNINENQQIGVVLEMNNLLYQGEGLKDYTTVDLNPYYHINNGTWNVRIGANVDFSLGRGTALRISPNVVAECAFGGSYAFYLQAKGGRVLNDFRQLEIYNPYANIRDQLPNTYEQVNASVGIKGSPVTGLWFHIFGGYQNLKDDLYITTSVTNMASSTLLYDAATYDTNNTENAYGGVAISYDYRGMFRIATAATYRHWRGDDKWALVFKPRLEVDANMEYNPVSKLLINIGYRYVERTKTIGVPSINNLYAGISYDFFKGISIYGKIDNILNKKYNWEFDYQAQGLNFIGGLSFQF